MTLNLHGDIASGVEQPKRLYKSTESQVVNNSTTLVDDDTLSMALEASTTYRFEFEVWWETTEPADFKTDIVYTGTTNDEKQYSNFSNPNANNATRETVDTALTAWTHSTTTAGTHGYYQAIGIIQTNTAGTLKLQWAQDTATVVDTKVLIGSRIVVELI